MVMVVFMGSSPMTQGSTFISSSRMKSIPILNQLYHDDFIVFKLKSINIFIVYVLTERYSEAEAYQS